MRVALVSELQHESLLDLLCELNTYYSESSSVPREVVRTHLLQNLLGVGTPLRLVVASNNNYVLGFAGISLTFSLVEPTPEKCYQCQLKELYVRSSERNAGVGRAIMAWVARYAAENGCRRIDWPVQAANARGISFYRALGAQHVLERLSFRLTEPSLSALASTSEAAHGG